MTGFIAVTPDSPNVMSTVSERLKQHRFLGLLDPAFEQTFSPKSTLESMTVESDNKLTKARPQEVNYLSVGLGCGRAHATEIVFNAN